MRRVGGWNFIRVTAPPTITLDGNKAICQNNTVSWNVDVTNPTPTGTLNVTWTRTPAVGVANSVSQTIANGAPTVSTQYSYFATLSRDLDVIEVEVENLCGVTTAGPSTLYVSPLPNLVKGADLQFCQTPGGVQNITFDVLNAETAGGVDVDWTVAATVTGSVAGSVTDLQNEFNLNNAGNGNGTISFDISGLGLLPGTYTITFNSITKDANSPNANYSSSCVRSLNQNISITVFPEPVVEITTADYENCQSATGSFNINISNATFGSPAQAVSWSFNLTQGGGSVANSCATGAGLSITNTGSGNQTVNVPTTSLAPGRYSFTLTGINNTTHTCVGTVSVSQDDAVEVSVIPRPNATLSLITQAVCEDDEGAFTIDVTDARYCNVGFAVANLDWSLAYTDGVNSDLVGPSPLTGLGNSSIPVVSNDGGALAVGIHTFEMSSITETTTGNTCSGTLSTANEYTLTVNPKPTMTAAVSSTVICEGTTGTITIEVDNAVVAGIGQNWAISYTQLARAFSQSSCGINYNPGILPTPTITGNGNRTIAGSNALTFTIPSNLPAGRYRYTFTGITNTSGTCSSSIGLPITIEFEIEPIPRVSFSPSLKNMCEDNTGETFQMLVTNAVQCDFPDNTGTTAQNFDITINDNVQPTAAAIVSQTGLGNQTYTYVVDPDLPVISATTLDHYFIATVKTNTTGTCPSSTPDTFRLRVEPRPVAHFATPLIEVCEGQSSSISVNVSNAVLRTTGVNWEIEFTEESALLSSNCTPSSGANSNLISSTGRFTGNGDGNTIFTVPATLAPGVYTFTLDRITNTAGPCEGFIIDNAINSFERIVVIVHPRMDVSLTPTVDTICQVGQPTFDLQVFNAETCSDTNILVNRDWRITYSDNVLSDAIALVGGASNVTQLFGTGNQIYTLQANSTSAIIAGTHVFTVSSITSLATGFPVACDSTFSPSKTYTLIVNPEPTVTWSTTSVDICENNSATVSITVSNAEVDYGAGIVKKDWSLYFSESSGNIPSSCNSGGVAEGLIPRLSSSPITGTGDSASINILIPDNLPPGVYSFALDSIRNTSDNCIRLLSDILVVNVRPQPIAQITPTIASVCQLEKPTFDINVTNAVYCPSVNGTPTAADWTLGYLDGVVSDVLTVIPGGFSSGSLPSSTSTLLYGTGNNTYTLEANSLAPPGLSPGGYEFRLTTIQNTTAGASCSSSVPVTGDSLYSLNVNPNPTAQWSTNTLEVCENTTGTFTLTIANAEVNYGAGFVDVDWQVTFTERSGNIPSACIDNNGAEGDFPGLDTGALTGTGNGVLTFNVPSTLAPGQYTFIISSVLNTTHSCTGDVIGNDTIVINVRPQPIAKVLTDTGRVCHGDDFNFDIAITNARYCPSVNNASLGAQWSLAFTDATQSDAVSNPLVNSDNATVTINANSLTPPGLPAGYYDFLLTTIHNTTPSAGCVSSVPVTGDSLFVLVINPKPTVDFSTTSLNLCEGAGGAFNFRVQNAVLASVLVAWSVTLTESSGSVTGSCNSMTSGIINSLTISGLGNIDSTINVPAPIAAGLYTYTITNITTPSSTPSCTGTILANNSITIRVNPTPIVGFTEDTISVCENLSKSFGIVVSNARHCPTVGSIANVNWNIVYTDFADTDVPATFNGTGNGTLTYDANSTPSLTATPPYSYYNFTINSITNTTHSCTNNKDTTLVVEVKSIPELTITNHTTPVCINSGTVITYNVAGIAAGQDWSFTYNIGTGAQTVTGTGSQTAAEFTTIGFASAGVNTVTFGPIRNINGPLGCIGNTPSSLSVTVLNLPDVTGLGFVIPPGEICSLDSAELEFNVNNSAGRNWKIYFSVGGVLDSLVGTGNGTFTTYTAPQIHTDVTGAYSNRTITINSIVWTVDPFCVNNNVTATDITLEVRPLPTIAIVGPANKCVNSQATVNFEVESVQSVENSRFRWTNTHPSSGPNNISNTGANGTGTFLTPALTPAGATNQVRVVELENLTTGCVQTILDTINIYIDPPSVAGFLDTSYTLCDDENGPFTVNLVGNAGTISWDSSQNSMFTWLATNNGNLNSWNFNYPKYTYYLRARVKNGDCPEDTTAPQIIFVKPRPKFTVTTSTPTLCDGGNAILNIVVDNVPTGNSWSISWTAADDSNPATAQTAITGTGSGNFTHTIPSLSANNYIFTLETITNTVQFCDSTMTTAINVEVKAKPTAGTVSANVTLCSGSQSVVNWTPGTGQVDHWLVSTSSASGAWTIYNSAAINEITLSNILSTTYVRAVIKNNPCTDTVWSPVHRIEILSANPLAEFINLNSSYKYCESGTTTETVDIQITGTNGADWEIRIQEGPSDSIVRTGTGNQTISYTTKAGSMLNDFDLVIKYIELKSGSVLCRKALGNTSTMSFEVIPSPSATLTSVPSELCQGSTILFTVDVSNVRSSDNWQVTVNLDGANTQTFTGTGSGSFNRTYNTTTVSYTGAGNFGTQIFAITNVVNTSRPNTLGNNCNVTNTDSKSITVYKITVGGSATASSAAVCKDVNSGTITVTGFTGDIQKWQYSTNSGATWTDIVSTSASINYSNLSVETWYRAVVKNGVCNTENSIEARITIEPVPMVSINNAKPTKVCEDGSVVLSVGVTDVTAGVSGSDWTINYTVDGTAASFTGSGNGTFTTTISSITQDVEVELVSIETRGANGMKCNNMVLTDKFEIKVIELPNATITSSPSELCTGSSVTFTTNVTKVGSTQNWTMVVQLANSTTQTVTGTGSGSFTFTTNASVSNNGTSPITQTLFIRSITNSSNTPTTGAACAVNNTDSADITVYPVSDAKTATASSTSICKGDSVNLIAASDIVGTIVRWEYKNASTSNVWTAINSSASTPFSVTNIQATTDYRVIVKSGPCSEAASVAVTVVVEPVPMVTISNSKPTTICKGDAVTMNVRVVDVTNGGSGSDWTLNYTVNGTAFTSEGTGNPASHAVNLGNIHSGSVVKLVSLTQRGNASNMKCENLALTDEFTIIVNDIPTVSIASHTDSICTGSTADVNVVVDNVKVGENWIIIYRMSNEASNRTFSGSGPGSYVFTTPVQTNTGTTHTTVDVSIIRIVNTSITPNCTDDSTMSVTIVISPATRGGNLTPVTREVCEGDNTGTITLSGHVGSVVGWEYSTDGGNTWTTTSNTGTTLTYSNILVTTWYRVLVESSPCASQYSSISRITVLPKPDATISGAPKVCPNDPAVFNLTVSNVPAGQAWMLTFNKNGTTRTFSGVGSGVFSLVTIGYPYTSTPSTIVVTLNSIQNTTSGCRNTELNSTVTAIITPNPIASFSVRNTCQDTAVSFTNLSSIVEGTIASYKWFFGNGDSSNASNPVYRYATPGTYTVRLIATSDNGCRGEVSRTITVFPSPVVNFDLANACQNQDFRPIDRTTVSSGTIY